MGLSSFTLQDLVVVVVQLVCIVFSVMVHEIAHGYAAYRLGDPTAKNAGRLTLNPAKHLDPVGSVVLPLVMSLMGGFIFAYAKPVPYNPYYFNNRKKGELIVAFAGPLSNVAQALVGALICFVVGQASGGLFVGMSYFEASQTLSWQILSITYLFGSYYCLINLVLFFFNIIPLPPLDGASIVAVFLNDKGMRVFYQIKQYSMFILLALLILVPMITPWNPLGWYMQHTAYAVFGLLVP